MASFPVDHYNELTAILADLTTVYNAVVDMFHTRVDATSDLSAVFAHNKSQVLALYQPMIDMFAGSDGKFCQNLRLCRESIENMTENSYCNDECHREYRDKYMKCPILYQAFLDISLCLLRVEEKEFEAGRLHWANNIPAPAISVVPIMPLPPNWFDLKSDIPTHLALQHACSIVRPAVSSEMFQIMRQQFHGQSFFRQRYTTFGYLPAPPAKYFAGAIKQIIGNNGAYFKMTTSQTEIDFIWHDRATDQFLFWGNRANVIAAMKIIRSRIIKYTAAQTQGQEEAGGCAECEFLGKDCESHQDTPPYTN